jgi:hypothetical protein
MNQLWQFGSKSEEEINAEVEENISNNTKKTRESIWKQFSRLHSFVKNYHWDHYTFFKCNSETVRYISENVDCNSD